MEPKVLIVIGDIRLTGPAKGVLLLMSKLAAMKGSFFLVNCKVAGADSMELIQEFADNEVIVEELVHRDRSYKDLLDKAARIATLHGVNIVQTHGYKQSLVGIYLKYRMGCKWICFMHGVTTESIRARVYNLLNNLMQFFASRTVLMSNSQRNCTIGGGNRNRVRVIPNGIDIDRPVRCKTVGGEVRSEYVSLDELLCVVIGRLSPEKGMDVFLQAFSLLQSECKAVKAVIVGDGPELYNLLSLRDQLGLEGDIYFAGYSQFPGDYLKAADIVVLPSRSEGIPNVALEAMALSRPIVATAVGGTPEIVEHNFSGILVPGESPAELAAAIRSLVEDKPLRETLASNGFNSVKSSFSLERRVDTVYSLYDELLRR